MNRHGKDSDNRPTERLTGVVVSNDLLERALQATGNRNRREVLELGLRTLLLQMQVQDELKQMRGTVEWVGDLDAMRIDR
jgi:hypothetical protein